MFSLQSATVDRRGLPKRCCCLCAVEKCGTLCGAGLPWCQGRRGALADCRACKHNRCPSFRPKPEVHPDQATMF